MDKLNTDVAKSALSLARAIAEEINGIQAESEKPERKTTTAQLYATDLAKLRALAAANGRINARDMLHRLIDQAYEASPTARDILEAEQANEFPY